MTGAEIIADTLLHYRDPSSAGGRERSDGRADAIIAALHAAGFKIIAREPTEAMMANMAAYGPGHLVPIFRTMWDAAP